MMGNYCTLCGRDAIYLFLLNPYIKPKPRQKPPQLHETNEFRSCRSRNEIESSVECEGEPNHKECCEWVTSTQYSWSWTARTKGLLTSPFIHLDL